MWSSIVRHLASQDMGRYYRVSRQVLSLPSKSAHSNLIWHPEWQFMSEPPPSCWGPGLPSFQRLLLWNNNCDSFGGKFCPPPDSFAATRDHISNECSHNLHGYQCRIMLEYMIYLFCSNNTDRLTDKIVAVSSSPHCIGKVCHSFQFQLSACLGYFWVEWEKNMDMHIFYSMVSQWLVTVLHNHTNRKKVRKHVF